PPHPYRKIDPEVSGTRPRQTPPDHECAGARAEVGLVRLRACLKIAKDPAARDFGGGRGGEVRASPQRAVRTEPTKATGKRPAARRGFAERARWLRGFSVGDRWRVSPLVAPCHPPHSATTGRFGIFRQALSR